MAPEILSRGSKKKQIKQLQAKSVCSMNLSELESAVVEFVNRPNYKPVKPRVIAKRLGLDENGAAQMKKAVKLLVKAGRIGYGQNHLLVPVATGPSPRHGESRTTQPSPKGRGR